MTWKVEGCHGDIFINWIIIIFIFYFFLKVSNCMFSCVHYIFELRAFPQAKSHLVCSLKPKRSRWFRRIKNSALAVSGHENSSASSRRPGEKLPPAADPGALFNRCLPEFDDPSVLIRTRHIRGNVKLTDI